MGDIMYRRSVAPAGKFRRETVASILSNVASLICTLLLSWEIIVLVRYFFLFFRNNVHEMYHSGCIALRATPHSHLLYCEGKRRKVSRIKMIATYTKIWATVSVFKCPLYLHGVFSFTITFSYGFAGTLFWGNYLRRDQLGNPKYPSPNMLNGFDKCHR
jgi:hypothetical protein